ncbi:uncharacterized protein MCYG_04557 [Microsporum canis CBS 113480]|uniref:Uncharacterized protein n=1 Tax=Arthroderma otae (strain ATCC MYA-4605 / CBS 113480) TaxID=554155 RepID=C5FNN5_ARTOC|nr:uncharacterized protein MCYG_04557 [Microsporum canis CBS 113480]EEQ31738.1 predicted protein [Microsporum canis CBS 113480]
MYWAVSIQRHLLFQRLWRSVPVKRPVRGGYSHPLDERVNANAKRDKKTVCEKGEESTWLDHCLVNIYPRHLVSPRDLQRRSNAPILEHRLDHIVSLISPKNCLSRSECLHPGHQDGDINRLG